MLNFGSMVHHVKMSVCVDLLHIFHAKEESTIGTILSDDRQIFQNGVYPLAEHFRRAQLVRWVKRRGEISMGFKYADWRGF